MARMPEFIQIDKAGPAAMLSLAPARASLLREIAARQHALMSGFGGHTQIFSTYIDGSSSTTTRQALFRVPPGVTRAQVSALIAGNSGGDVVLRTPSDPVGINMPSGRAGDGSPATARWIRGSYDEGTAFFFENRLLILENAASEDWRTVSGTIECDGFSVFAIALSFIHRAR
jgi:hypothetical protein